MRSPKAKFLIALTGAALLSACTSGNIYRGYVFDESLVSAVQPGVDNRDSVKAMLGNPSTSSTFGDKRWYYIKRTQVKKSFFDEKPISQEIVEIAFADDGTVKKVDKIDLKAAHKVDPVQDRTPTRGRHLGFFQQIFGNIGRFGGAGGAGGAGGGGGPGG